MLSIVKPEHAKEGGAAGACTWMVICIFWWDFRGLFRDETAELRN